MEEAASRRPLRVIAITSGKGGVGKTHCTVNLAIAFAQRGRKVLIVDGDVGLANVDILLDETPRYTRADVLSGERKIQDIVVQTSYGISVLPGTSGLIEMSEMSDNDRMRLLQAMEELVADTQSRVEQLEDTIRIQGQSEASRLENIDQVNAEVSRLRGEIEVLQFELTEQTRDAVAAWAEAIGLRADDYLFPGRPDRRSHLSARQYARLVADWVAMIGLDPVNYGTHSLRRTKATLIYRRTKNLRAVQLLLGHTKLESTVRYLGIEMEDALEIAEKTEV